MGKQEEMNAVLDELSTELLDRALDHALEEGWPEELAEILAVTALDPFLQDVFDDVPAEEAFKTALEEARFILLEDAFVEALEEGQSHRDAFMLLLGIELRLAENRNEPTARFPIEWIEAGVAAMEDAEKEGQSVTRQLINGFEAFRVAAIPKL